MKSPKNIVDRIKEKRVKQIPKWYFTLKKVLNRVFFSICILLGGAAFSVILLSIQQTDFDLVSHISHSSWEFILGLLPFFWIVILLTLLVLAMIAVKRSVRGYKYDWWRIFGLNTAASILLGTLFFIGGGGHQLESVFIEKVKYYNSVQKNKMQLWMRPEKGFLAGTVNTMDNKKFTLDDFYGYLWEVDFSNAFVSNGLEIKKGKKVKLIGKTTSPYSFKVKEIRPWTSDYGNYLYHQMGDPTK